MKAKVTNGATVIEIYGVKISNDVQKKFLAEMPTFIAKTGGAWPATEPEMKMMEFKQVKQVVTITGTVDKGSISGKTYAHEVVDELIDLLTDGGVMTLEIKNNAWGVTILSWTSEAYASKLTYHSVPTDEDIPTLFDVIISFVKAKELTS